MKAAVVSNDVIVNVIIVDDLSFDPGNGLQLVDLDGSPAGIGWVRQQDGSFALPEPPVDAP